MEGGPTLGVGLQDRSSLAKHGYSVKSCDRRELVCGLMPSVSMGEG